MHVNMPGHNYSCNYETADNAAGDIEEIASIEGLTARETKFFIAVYEKGRRMDMKVVYVPANEMMEVTLT